MRLSEEAVASYRAAAAALDPRLEALVALLVSDGLKVAEALALDIDDVSGRPPATTITVRRRRARQSDWSSTTTALVPSDGASGSAAPARSSSTNGRQSRTLRVG